VREEREREKESLTCSVGLEVNSDLHLWSLAQFYWSTSTWFPSYSNYNSKWAWVSLLQAFFRIFCFGKAWKMRWIQGSSLGWTQWPFRLQ
jgi:hypothetical protein